MQGKNLKMNNRELSYKTFRLKLENKLGLEPNALLQEKDKIKSIIEELSSSPTKRRNQHENMPRKKVKLTHSKHHSDDKSICEQRLMEMCKAVKIAGPSLYKLLKGKSEEEKCELMREKLFNHNIHFVGEYPSIKEIKSAEELTEKIRDLDGIDPSNIITGKRKRNNDEYQTKSFLRRLRKPIRSTELELEDDEEDLEDLNKKDDYPDDENSDENSQNQKKRRKIENPKVLTIDEDDDEFLNIHNRSSSNSSGRSAASLSGVEGDSEKESDPDEEELKKKKEKKKYRNSNSEASNAESEDTDKLNNSINSQTSCFANRKALKPQKNKLLIKVRYSSSGSSDEEEDIYSYESD